MSLTCIILTKEEKINSKLLNSVSFCDEIIVLHDANPKKEKQEGKIRHLYHPLNFNFSEHRNWALKQSKGDWTLFVDDDEYVTTELAEEIKQAIDNTKYSGFLIPRRDVVFYDEIKHGEVGNVSFLRLAKTTAGEFKRNVHEYWQIEGKTGKLKNLIYHTKDNFVSESMSRMRLYSPIDAKILKQEDKPFSYTRLLFYPKAKFIVNFFFKLGFLDGYVGLFLAYIMSVQSLTNRIFQWEQARD